MEKHHQRYKADFDRSVKTPEVIKPGNLIYVSRATTKEDLSTDEEIGAHKLRSRAVGPLDVVDVDDNTVQIVRDGLLDRITKDRVRKALFEKEDCHSDTEQELSDEDAEDEPTNNQAHPTNDNIGTPSLIPDPLQQPSTQQPVSVDSSLNNTAASSSAHDKSESDSDDNNDNAEEPNQPRK